MAKGAGHAVLRLLENGGPLPRDLVTKKSLENACAAVAATGGSTNAGLHIPAIAHEAGHLSARDNLKRSLLRACGDALLMIPCGRSLDRAWADTSESAADEYAAQTSSATAVNLAAALVKVARMVPKGSRAAVPVAAFLVGNEEDRGIKARVRRLLEIASNQEMRDRTFLRYRLTLPLFLLAMPAAAVVVHHTNSDVLASLHLLIEHTVHLLS